MAFIPPRVLCIDDDEDSRVMLVTLLRLERIHSKAVASAAEALAAIKSERFDLYLTDVRLPDLNGFELCRRLRDSDPAFSVQKKTQKPPNSRRIISTRAMFKRCQVVIFFMH